MDLVGVASDARTGAQASDGVQADLATQFRVAAQALPRVAVGEVKVTEPEIRAIAKLRLRPGDTLVVFIPRDRSDGQHLKAISSAHRATFGDSVKLIIAPDDMKFGVLETLP